MLGRVVTWIFYAVVFFFLGVWASPRLPALGQLSDRAIAYGQQGWDWLSNSGPAAQPGPAAPEAAAAPQAPETAGALAAARQAFQAGDVAGAVRIYRTLIAANPALGEARGELGNALYGTGQIAEAAQVYFDLAAWQLDRGDASAARALEPAIRRGNARLADELVHRMGGLAAAPAPGSM